MFVSNCSAEPQRELGLFGPGLGGRSTGTRPSAWSEATGYVAARRRKRYNASIRILCRAPARAILRAPSPSHSVAKTVCSIQSQFKHLQFLPMRILVITFESQEAKSPLWGSGFEFCARSKSASVFRPLPGAIAEHKWIFRHFTGIGNGNCGPCRKFTAKRSWRALPILHHYFPASPGAQ